MGTARVDRDQCFFPTSEAVDWKVLGTALTKHFVVKPSGAGALSLAGRTPDAPKPFTVTEFSLGDIPAATGMRGPYATRWKRELVSTYARCLSLHFEDLRAVLAETNSLILAQETIQKVTRGPIVLAWNREVIAADVAGT